MKHCRIVTAAALSLGLLVPHAQAAPEDTLTVLVVVVDSLMPHEVGSSDNLTPTLDALSSEGTWYTESRSVFSAETIPNHVAMMTGRYPENNGIPTNNYWDRQPGSEDRNLSLPTELEAPTLFRRIKDECPQITTAAVMSKGYLYEVFSECGLDGAHCGIHSREPDYFYNPIEQPTYIPESGHTPDVVTMAYARQYMPFVNFMFVNLGDVDRSGHMDVTGPFGKAIVRASVLIDTDQQIDMLVRELKSAGRWESTVLFIVSDHGMDWSLPNGYINLTPVLETVAPGKFMAVDNGGTDSIYFLDRNDRAAWLQAGRLYEAIRAVPGVENAWFTSLHSSLTRGLSRERIRELLLPEHFRARHENLGDIVVSAAPGYRFTETSPNSNPIPGNHGHKATLHNTFMISGGAPFLRRGNLVTADPAAMDGNGEVDHFERLPGQSENIDVAPTVAWLLGMKLHDEIELRDASGEVRRDANGRPMVRKIPRYDGRPLTEAFDLGDGPATGSCGSVR